jgi:galactoside O-acetyltransferase
MRSILKNEVDAFLYFLFRYLPGKSGSFLRYQFLRNRFQSCGTHVSISEGAWFKGMENIRIGSYVGIGAYNYFFAESTQGPSSISVGNSVTFNVGVMVNADVCGTILIEDNAMIGPYVVIRASGHQYENPEIPIRKQGHLESTIVIEDGAWIGAHAVILPGVTVGKGAIVGAGAVVTRNVGAMKIVGGVPARSVKSDRVVIEQNE